MVKEKIFFFPVNTTLQYTLEIEVETKTQRFWADFHFATIPEAQKVLVKLNKNCARLSALVLKNIRVVDNFKGGTV